MEKLLDRGADVSDDERADEGAEHADAVHDAGDRPGEVAGHDVAWD